MRPACGSRAYGSRSCAQALPEERRATAGGVPPDVCGLPSALVPISAENNALLPLEKWSLVTWSACASDLCEAVGKVWTGKPDAAAALAEAQRHPQSSLDSQHARGRRLSARLTAEWEREP